MKEAYVKLETAQLLKEKGFDWYTYHYYDEIGRTWFEDVLCDWNHRTTPEVSCPTQQMAIRWFWEEKGLNVNAIYGDYPALKKAYWMPQIDSLNGCYGVDDEDFFREYDSREDCIEAALEYALRNLI